MWCGIQAVICSWLYELLMSLRLLDEACVLCSGQTVVVKSKMYTFLRLTLTLKYLHLIMIDNFRTVQVLWLWSSSQWGWLWMASISIRGVLSWENNTTISPAFFIAWWDLFICRCSLSIFPYYYQWDNKALTYVYLQFSGKMREVQRFLSRICAHKVRDNYIVGKAALLSNTVIVVTHWRQPYSATDHCFK